MKVTSQPTTIWIDPRLVLRRSPIHGIGTFTTGAISEGEALIIVNGGIVYTAADWSAGKIDLEADLYNEETLPDGLRIATPKSFHYYINHAADPNAIDLSRFGTGTYYVARRSIHAGEEITAKYLSEEG